MFPRQTGSPNSQRYQGNSGVRGRSLCLEPCMEQCCNPQHDSNPWTQGPRNFHDTSYHSQQASQGHSQPLYSSNMRHPVDNQHSSSLRTHNQYDTCSIYPGVDTTSDLSSNLKMGGDNSHPWGQLDEADVSCDDWAHLMTRRPPLGSSTGYCDSSGRNQRPVHKSGRDPGCQNLQGHYGYTEDCNLKHPDDNPGLFSRLMSKIRPPPSHCPLTPPSQTAKAVSQTNSCFSAAGSSRGPDDVFNSLDCLWNPKKIRRWSCVNEWDQHKESQWKQVIENKLSGCGPAGRSVESKICEALDALHHERSACIAYRMFYGILKRNEDVYLNPFIELMTDDEFLKLIVALNNFYFEDKDKAKSFLDLPPPTWIESIIQKETLTILDPNSRAPTIVRRFWDVLLDWYARKLVEKGDPSAGCAASKTASQSSVGSLC